MALLIMGELDYGPLISHQIYLLIFKVIVYFLMRPFHVVVALVGQFDPIGGGATGKGLGLA